MRSSVAGRRTWFLGVIGNVRIVGLALGLIAIGLFVMHIHDRTQTTHARLASIWCPTLPEEWQTRVRRLWGWTCPVSATAGGGADP